jgi:hypothetical protein
MLVRRLLSAGVGLAVVLTAAASGSHAARSQPDRMLPNCCGVNVRIPPGGEISLTVVRFRGRRVPRPALTNLRRLPSGALVVAARRSLRNGRSEVWLGVVNRKQTSARTLASAAEDTAVKFRVSGGSTLKRLSTIQLRNLAQWPARPPAVCNGITNETITGPQTPRPVQAWDARTDLPVPPLTWPDYLRAACDLPLSPARAELWGIPHGMFTFTVKPPSSLLVTGTISEDSMGFVLTRLPEGITGLSGKDGGRCAPGTRGTEHFIACLAPIPAKQSIEIEAFFDKPVDSFVFDPLLGVFVRNVEYGPFSVARNP